MKNLPVAMMSIAIAFGPAAASAQEHFPSHPIQMIVPTGPGGGTDVSARLLASLAEAELGQKVIVLNKPGAAGATGVETMLQAPADGYTIAGVWNSPITIAPQMFDVHYKRESYVPIELSDIAPVTYCVMKDFPANTGQEFLNELKAHPNKYTYATDGVAGNIRLTAELIFSNFGIHARAIPYSGSTESLESFLGHNVDIYGGGVAPIVPFVQKGTAKCLILSTAKGNAVLPNAASLTDLGVPDDATVVWHAIIAPAAVPPDRLAILTHAFIQAATSAKFKAFAITQGQEAVGMNSADARKLMDTEYKQFGGVIKDLGLNTALTSK